MQPLKEILDGFGGWPVVVGDEWDDSEFVWYEMIYNFRKVGYSIDYFVDFSIVADLKNSTWRTIDVIIFLSNLSFLIHIIHAVIMCLSWIKPPWECPAVNTC